MSWYRAGTVTVTNGSAVVTGAGTDFVANANPGDAFVAPDGRGYEVASIQSATQLMLSTVYLGGTGGGQAYALLPTQSFARDLALAAAALLGTFGAVRDGIGQGLIPDGTLAAPGIRFAADPDTGVRRIGGNSLSLVAGGTDRLLALNDGNVVVAGGYLNAIGANNELGQLVMTRNNVGSWFIGGNIAGQSDFTVRLNGTEMARVDTSGNLLVGATNGTAHRIVKPGAEGQSVISFDNNSAPSLVLYSVTQSGFSTAAAAMVSGRNSSTGRSLNAGGTINASGADYAEYMRKADGCGTIAKGDVCGVDANGHLTKTWADAVSFVIKSTDPSYVGGDTWSAHLAPRPEAPAPLMAEPKRGEDEEADAFLARHDAWTAERTRFNAEQPAYEQALAAWEAELEAARVTVDRIAFAGQVPVNVTGDFAVGDYLIAVANGGGIKAVAVPAADITFDQYRARVGKVWAVRDGRAWVDVQHG